MSKIVSTYAREILDSRGQPTVEVEVSLDGGALGRAAVPSGASTGEHEAVELRDGDSKRYHGKGVLKAVSNVVNMIAPAIIGKDPEKQEALDEAMIRLDGTPNKGLLGANAILGVSMAVTRAAAAQRKMPLYQYLRKAFGLAEKEWLLPAPMLNVINGGKHADSGLDVQEFMLVPTGAPNFREALRMGSETYSTLKKTLAVRKLATSVGDEGGFAPRLKSHEEALDILTETVAQAGYAQMVRLAIDAAASEFFQNGKYRCGGSMRSAAEMIRLYGDWTSKYRLLSVEDPFDQDDWEAWKQFTQALGGSLRIIGDDIFVTNLERLEKGIRDKTANAVLIKLNQIGTVTETVRAVLRAHKAGFTAVISHRSGETEDPYIADFAVALNAGAIKTGAPCRSERLAKYNQLLRIEEELGRKADYAGERAFKPKRA